MINNHLSILLFPDWLATPNPSGFVPRNNVQKSVIANDSEASQNKEGLYDIKNQNVNNRTQVKSDNVHKQITLFVIKFKQMIRKKLSNLQ